MHTTRRGFTFCNQTIRIDNVGFYDCTFTECTLVFSGGPYALENCTFINVRHCITGAACGVLDYARRFELMPEYVPPPVRTALPPPKWWHRFFLRPRWQRG